jgi:hypothetical protein
MPTHSEPTLAIVLGLEGNRMHEELADVARSVSELDKKQKIGAVLAPGFWRGVGKDFQSVVAEELGAIPLSKVLVDAWLKARELRSFADPAVHPRGESSTVALAKHSVSSSHTVQVDLLVNGVKRKTLALDVELELELGAAHLRILDGRIRALSPGTVSASASVKWEGRELKRLPLRTFDLPGELLLDPGVPLTRIDRYAPVVTLPADVRLSEAQPPSAHLG